MQTKDVAEALMISTCTVRRWLREKRLPHPKRDHRGWRAWTERDLNACRKLLMRLHGNSGRTP